MNTTPLGLLLVLLMCATITAGCGATLAPPPPTPHTISGMTRDRTSYTFLKWNGGLAIMLVDQCDVHSLSGSGCDGESDRRKGDAHWWDQETNEWQDGYEWELETSDGRTAQFSINNVQYDLEQGRVFHIDAKGDQATVQQLDRDLTNVQPNRTSCNNFVTADPELTKTTEGVDSE